MLQDIHSGMCGAHIAPHEIAHRALRQGFYWPSATEDAKQLVRDCQACQMFARKQSAPANPTKGIIPTWPLQRWGIDIVGPLPPAPGNLRFVAVTLEYLTKWTEVKALAKITSSSLTKFAWQRMICRFGVPSYITNRQWRTVRLSRFPQLLR